MNEKVEELSSTLSIINNDETLLRLIKYGSASLIVFLAMVFIHTNVRLEKLEKENENERDISYC